MFPLYNSLYFVCENFCYKRVLKIFLAPSFLGILQETGRLTSPKNPPEAAFALPSPPSAETLRHSAVPFRIWTHLSLPGISNISSDFWEFTSSLYTSPPFGSWPLTRNEVSLILDWNQEDPDGLPLITGMNFSPQAEVYKKQCEIFFYNST